VATTVRLGGLASSLTVRQKKADCNEVADELGHEVADVLCADGPSVAVYPSRAPLRVSISEGGETRTTGNCRNYGEARRAEDLGLPAMNAVCIVCAYKTECPFLEELEAAPLADHVVMTAARAEFTDFETASEDRDAVFVANGRALDVLKPAVRAVMAKERALESLDRIVKAASSCRDGAGFFGSVKETALRIRSLVEGDKGGVVEVPPGDMPPREWAVHLKARLGVRDPPEGFEGLMRICLLNATDELDGPPVVRPLGRDRFEFLAARPARELSQPVLILDPTVTAGEIERATGRAVRLIEPFRPPKRPRGVVQVAETVTARKRPGPVADIIRGHLWGGRGRAGVVLPQKLHEPVRRELGPGLAERVVFAGWQDGLRGESDGCRLTLVLGLPPVPSREVAKRLVQTGRPEDAARGGDWGPAPWTTESGAVVQRSAYRDPVWRATHFVIRAGRLGQVLAGVRGRVIVYADEPLGLRLTKPRPPLDGRDWALLTALCPRGRTGPEPGEPEGGPGASPETALGASSSSLLRAFSGDALNHRTTKELSAAAGLSESAARERLNRLGSAGLVTRRGKRGPWALAP
jgi:hypothetical protein